MEQLIDLKRLRFEQNLSQQKLGDLLKVTKQQISNIESGKSKLTTEQKEILIKNFGDILQSQMNDLTPDPKDCITVDYIHINPSCGKGTSVYHDADITPIKLGTQMLQSVLKVSHPQNLKVFKASGDSMTPTIEDSDMLLVDTGRTDFNNGGIFLLTINNDWFIKRLRKRITGELDIISDNDKYPVETFKQDTDIEVFIKGRVIKNLSRGL